MDLHFLGGATTVTGSRFLLTTGRARILVDCGMFQGSPNESIRNRIPLGFDPTTLDAIVLTHAHLDHCGLLPIAVREGFQGPIYLTSATAELATLVLLDSGRLHEEFAKREAKWEKRHPDDAITEDRERASQYVEAIREAERGERGEPAMPPSDGGAPTQPPIADSEAVASATGGAGEGPGTPRAATRMASEPLVFATGSVGTGEHVPTSIEPDGSWTAHPARDPEAELRAQKPELIIDLDAPLYTERDAAAVPPLFRTLRYEREQEIAPGVHLTLLDAGHILGSAIVRLRVDGADGRPERTIVFSGDLGRPGTPILRDPTFLNEADYVVVESTYGGREHEPSDEAVRILAETVREVDRMGGVLLVPSFAIGRTQEIVYELDRLIEDGAIPLLPLYLDSPMASRASEVYRRHPEMYDETTRDLLASGDTPLDYPDQRITNNVKDSRRIATARRPYMIVASNGMLTGGRVVSHLRNLIDDRRATLLFVGYQGEGTLGAHLQAGAQTVKIDGQVRPVRCRVRSISGFSAHADESEILDWLSRFGERRRAGDEGFPRKVFLVHGDPDAQIALAPRVEALGFRAHVPVWHQRVELD